MTTYAVSGSPSVFTIEGDVLGGFIEYVLKMGQEVIDSTSDDSSRWDEFKVGPRHWELEIDGLYIYTDSAQIWMEQHLTDEEPIKVVVMLTPVNEKVFQGNGVVESLYYTAGFESVTKIDVDIRGTSALVTTES